jgi:glycosyltransferase involved in cell wall biosynthesis
MGGSIASVYALGKLLSKQHEVHLWTTDHDAAYIDPAIREACRVRLFRRPGGVGFMAPGMLPALLSNTSEFASINVFHFWTAVGLFGGLVAPREDCPVFVHSQGIFLPVALSHHGARKRAAQALGGRRLLNRFSGVIACNISEIPGIRAWGCQKPIYVLPNAVLPLTAERGVFRRQLELPGDVRIVTFLNRFDPIKRTLELAQAFRIVQDSTQNVIFVFAGDAGSDYGREVQAYAAASGLRARFLGYLGPQEKWNLLADSDMLCQFSLQEGHSNALTEAIAAGVPVIASRGCNFEEIGVEDAGLIVDSVEEMAHATTRLLRDEPMRRGMAENAKRLAQRFTPAAIGAAYVNIIEQARNSRWPLAASSSAGTVL